jgi:hypothetical protein
MDKDTLLVILITLFFFHCLFRPIELPKDDWEPNTPEKIEKLVDAIYIAEGGHNASVPFGIKSIKCYSYEDCRQICRNTVFNNYQRWKKDKKDSYLVFLWNRYAPPKVHPLNQHWLKNVRSNL